jgi:hypothetical protein
MKDRQINIDSLDALTSLNDRLYCAWHALIYGDDMMIDHCKKIGSEVWFIWNEIDNILEQEGERLEFIEEEMKKFKEGFAYRAPDKGTQGSCCDRRL